MLRAQYKRSDILGFLRLISFVDKNPGAGVYVCVCVRVTHLLCIIVYGKLQHRYLLLKSVYIH